MMIVWIGYMKIDKVKQKGKQNTQLELGGSKLSAREVVAHLISRLISCRELYVQYQCRNQMSKVDMSMDDTNLHCTICTYFDATLNLVSAEKDNCSVDTHAVICIFIVVYDC